MKFMDLRQWIALLEKEGELRRITAEVDWNREIGAIARRVLEKKGPALLFESIKGYRSGRCSKLFVSGLGAQSRLALALGFPRGVANRELTAEPFEQADITHGQGVRIADGVGVGPVQAADKTGA